MQLMKWRLPILVALVLAAAWFSPHDPLQQFREYASIAPQCGDPCFLLGSDGFGRDVLSRTLYGGRISMLVGLGAASIALLIGGSLGSLAGARRGWFDEVLSRFMDILIALPWLYLLLAARAALPLHIQSTDLLLLMMFLLGTAGSGSAFRLARQIVRATLEGDAVKAAFGLGCTRTEVWREHLVPSATPALLSLWQAQVPQFVVAEVALSFLGLGITEPTVSWGTSLASLREYPVLTGQWWMFTPALALAIVSFSLGYNSKPKGVPV
jgi:peptide/nickel transport system permease protein